MVAPDAQILTLAARIVAAHLSHNSVDAALIPALISSVYNTLVSLELTARESAPEHLRAMVAHHRARWDSHVHDSSAHTHSSPRDGAGHFHPEFGQTVFDDHLICQECGVSMKMLKRHLQTVHGMTPRDYRAKWDLSDDYPMVAANYAKLRSSLALESGLGLKPDARAGRLARHRR
jgi:predicted transcriptional regulator